jgi:hypothetical protein
MKTISRLYLVDRKSVCFIKSIFEAYDGIASVTTIDPHISKIELLIPPGCAADAETLIEVLRHDFLMEPAD